MTFHRETDARPFWLAYECIRPRQQSSLTEPNNSDFRLHSIFDGDTGGKIDPTRPTTGLGDIPERCARGEVGDVTVSSGAGGPAGSRGHQRTESSGSVGARCETLWMPYCICLVSRLPYIGVMKDVLDSIMPKLVHSNNLGDFLSGVMADIARVPPPPNGAVAVQFRLRQQFCASVPRFIVCKPPPLVDLPIIDSPLRFILLMLSPEQVLTIVGALLTEQRIIFVSSEYAKLTPIINALLALIYPFKWQHVYIPVIPAHLRAFIDAPWPYLIGIHARYIDDILHDCGEQAEQPIVVNLDTRSDLLSIPRAFPLFKSSYIPHEMICICEGSLL